MTYRAESAGWIHNRLFNQSVVLNNETIRGQLLGIWAVPKFSIRNPSQPTDLIKKKWRGGRKTLFEREQCQAMRIQTIGFHRRGVRRWTPTPFHRAHGSGALEVRTARRRRPPGRSLVLLPTSQMARTLAGCAPAVPGRTTSDSALAWVRIVCLQMCADCALAR